MSADPWPELSTNEEWREMLASARRERKWKQEDLAKEVERHTRAAGSLLTATQPLISQLESGQITNSRLVRPICQIMSLPEPMHFGDEEMKQWWKSGHLLRSKNMALFKAQLEAMQSTLKALGVESVANDETRPPNDKPRK